MMIALFYMARKCPPEEAAMETGIILLFQPEYADDGFYGGRIQDAIRYFREEIRLAAKFGLKNDLSQYIMDFLSGDHFRRNLPGL